MKIIYKPFGESVIKLNNFRFSLDLLDIGGIERSV